MTHPVLLTVRGTLVNPSIEAARALHNQTAGSKEGMEAARALSDVSHAVYVPTEGQSELLFLDTWLDPQGLQTFFGNPHVQQQGASLFSSKDASVWMPARGAFTFAVPPVGGARPACIGLLRAQVKSPEAAIEAIGALQQKSIAAARRRGQLSHQLYVRMADSKEPIEILGVDVWSTESGMNEHYAGLDEMQSLASVMDGPPSTSTWRQGDGFSEW